MERQKRQGRGGELTPVGIGGSAFPGRAPSGAAAAGKSPAGKTRTCPHCKTTILESAAICPACQHHLRFDPSSATERRAAATLTPLKVQGTIHHPSDAEPWEYTVVLTIRNEGGEKLTRQVLGVGALQRTEQRSFELCVEITPVQRP